MSRLTGELAPVDETCGRCGLAVGGWSVGVTSDGRRTWDRPSYTTQKPDGSAYTSGGLTHVEGGARCVTAVQVTLGDADPPPVALDVRLAALATARGVLAARAS